MKIKSIVRAVTPHVLYDTAHYAKWAKERARVWRQYREYEKLSGQKLDRSIAFFYLHEATEISGHISDPYTYQDTWAARLIDAKRPAEHVDVASSPTFVIMTSILTKVITIDIRPFVTSLPNVDARRGSVLQMPFEDNSVESLSSLSVIEHIGLGRYGDALDPQGTVKAAAEMERILKPGGDLYVAVPTQAKTQVHFNGYRGHTPEDFIALFPRCRLLGETYAQSDGYLSRAEYDAHGRPYAYGCFHFTK